MSNLRLSGCTIICLCLMHLYSFAQAQPTGSVKGKLTDLKQIALSYTTVGIYQAKDTSLIRSTLTDESGLFSFEQVPYGTYLIGVQAIGYDSTFTKAFTIDASHPNFPAETIALKPSTRQLKAVNVTAKKPLIERRNDKLIVNVAGSTLAAGNNALQILSKAPGITVDNEGNVNLRGRPGVSIMIDGKLTYLSGQQLANLLRSTDGNTIQSIEIISQPSARYDASGSGGIINIKLKKNTTFGTNGTLTAGTGYGNGYKANGGLMLNNRSKHVNLYGNYDLSNDKSRETLLLDRSTSNGTENTYFDQQGRDVNLSKNRNYKVGMDYYFDENHVLGAMLSGYNNEYKSNSQVNTLIGSQPQKIDSIVRAQNPAYHTNQSVTYNLNYKAVLDTSGHELNIDVDHSRVRNQQQTTYNNLYFNGMGTVNTLTYIFRNTMPSNVNIFTAKIDHTYPFNTHTKLETGLKTSFVNTDNDLIFEDRKNNDWVNNLQRSNRFIYKENVNAAYANLQHSFGATTLQAGLRAELTRSTGNSVTLQSINDRRYLDLFPSFSVNQHLGADHELGLTYSRRIQRPDYGSLNPFVYYADIYTLNQGNPNLRPQYTNAIELSYGFKKSNNFTFSYSRTTDVITAALLTDTIRKTLTLYEKNLASRSTASINFNRPLAITKWWNTSNDVTLYYSKFSSPNLMGQPFNSGKTTLNFRSDQTFTINGSTNAELAANYASAQVFGTYVAQPIYSIDMGVSRSFANKRANLKFAISDVFNNQIIKVRSAIAQQDYKLSQKQETRVFRLTFSYNFGSSTIKAIRERDNGSSAEQSRIKGN
ncbi:TonB-dependent receptor [Mucilaginibacter daejeonensis]|uniref:outer membrane beta-barrel protein n=1 Tax=Mucilaginibacter daejeonensis TaxID=398049 RepID=UPI001D177F36|nr:outer membrane beta-barrel protein [Mucilaginibacter daejeonensis]UEG54394.1 TonB-dependent receptor [Mucilaginibacter daejeonensis]